LGQSNTSTANFPTAIEQLNVNVADVKTSGMDFEGDYATTIGDGRLNLRVLANYLIAYTQKQSPSAALQVFAGNLDGGPNPLFRATGIANYSWGNYDVTVEERFIGHVARSLILDYSDTNEIPHIMYTNLEIGYTLPVSFYGGGNMRFFFNVQNLFNQQPPLIPNNGTPNLVFPTNRELYDVIGTDFMMGVRAKF
jgi:outer membrane receptor protein involved in Fe transport